MRAVCRPASCSAKRLARRRDIKQPLAAIVLAFALHDVTVVDELLEHAAKRLLGDLENVEQVRNLHAGIAVDEMQNAVVRPPEGELGQHFIGIANEVAIGEEEKFDEIPAGFGAPAPDARSLPRRGILPEW